MKHFVKSFLGLIITINLFISNLSVQATGSNERAFLIDRTNNIVVQEKQNPDFQFNFNWVPFLKFNF